MDGYQHSALVGSQKHIAYRYDAVLKRVEPLEKHEVDICEQAPQLYQVSNLRL